MLMNRDEPLTRTGDYTHPLTQGYALTADQNIVHVDMVARYRVRQFRRAAFYGPKAEDVLRVEVTAAMIRSLGEMTVDRVLAEGRKERSPLPRAALKQAWMRPTQAWRSLRSNSRAWSRRWR